MINYKTITGTMLGTKQLPHFKKLYDIMPTAKHREGSTVVWECLAAAGFCQLTITETTMISTINMSKAA